MSRVYSINVLLHGKKILLGTCDDRRSGVTDAREADVAKVLGACSSAVEAGCPRLKVCSLLPFYGKSVV